MTPLPSAAELASRGLLDPPPSTLHLHDLINACQDGIYAKDRLSDQVIGMLIFAVDSGIIKAWEGTIFQVPFVQGFKLRKGQLHLGRPFLGPDGKVLKLRGVVWCGEHQGEVSALEDLDVIKRHSGYAAWVRGVLYCGGTKNDGTYVRRYIFNSLVSCDANVNNKPYAPGPLSIMPGGAAAADLESENDASATSKKRKRGLPAAAARRTSPEIAEGYCPISDDSSSSSSSDDKFEAENEPEASSQPINKSPRSILPSTPQATLMESTTVKKYNGWLLKGIEITVKMTFTKGGRRSTFSEETVVDTIEEAREFMNDNLSWLENEAPGILRARLVVSPTVKNQKGRGVAEEIQVIVKHTFELDGRRGTDMSDYAMKNVGDARGFVEEILSSFQYEDEEGKGKWRVRIG
ncbi:hypothetical protein ONS95_004131 [Cadophora gregata]|uniref:uncharacterized protein n=1 Tax=Cadophora gregata TaxID=51156 RepID=UPI0026DC81A6|nr:uncharacterized protein ONS95_004131 [Cadophora gregata]KAK0105508.1 hypothetical protein ONS96_004894 [Cadophora gregata f. sp. sojae]KAK0105599.1 hypothetical protein ONS95_004131 [Cadophora gregata]